MSTEEKPKEKTEATTNEAPKPTENTPETIEKATASFTERLQKAFDEALEVKLKAMEKRFDTMIDEKLSQLEIEAEQVLRKGLGVDKDVPLTNKDVPKLIQMIRKAALENTEKERAPAATEKAGPEGNKPQNPIDDMFKPFEKEAPKP